MTRALGFALMVSPLVAGFAYMCLDGGLRAALTVLGIVAVIVAPIVLGAWLFVGPNPQGPVQ